ncbi:glutaredoxin family protein [Deinococcus ruber]|uniref:NrdH-redoxin n=1 Tax=Deinococcus ruber TaxID=1848197 RepID=A0A918CK19_9DEIO|nr:glutaredoxin family protein [Deinococcus ruber]GGR27162.1 NrdH-redoxin [Deinococcus ruber]
MPEITVYTVPNCADCAAVKALLTRHGAAFTERNVRGDPDALAELLRRANVRIAPVVMIGEQAYYGPFDTVKHHLTAALTVLEARL